MGNIALVLNGVVENVAVWDGVSSWSPGSQYILINVTGTPTSIGWTTTDNIHFSPPDQD
jgi:hypothetical protein